MEWKRPVPSYLSVSRTFPGNIRAGSAWQTSKGCTHPKYRWRRASLRDRLGEIWTRLVKLMISHPYGKRRYWWAFLRAEDGNTEEWLQGEYDKNAADSCIPIRYSGFRFIKNFADGSFFSSWVVGIQSNDKRKCKFRGKCFWWLYWVAILQSLGWE